MKKTLKIILVALISVSALNLTSCQNPPAGTESAVSAFVNWAEGAATAFINDWIHSHLGASRTNMAANSSAETAFVKNTRVSAQAKFPNLTPTQIDNGLREAYRNKL